MNNERGYGKRVVVTAGANRTGGTLVYEGGLHGIVAVTTVSGQKYALSIEQREYEVDAVTTPAKGEAIYITAAQALTKTVSTNRLVGFVTGVAGEPGVPTGKMHILLAPQNATVPS